jgi:hypothetical protein
VSDIDTAAADSLKVLDPKRPIREADIAGRDLDVRFVPIADIRHLNRSPRRQWRATFTKWGGQAAWQF